MKWFKHDANANMDAALQEILLDYGLEGYGLYWYCLELIAGKIEPERLTFELEHDARIIARNTGCTVQKVTEMMTKFVDFGLFENVDGVITCLKMGRRTDEYTAKLLRQKEKLTLLSGSTPDILPTNSGDTTDKVRSNRIDKNRIEEKRREENREDKNIKNTPVKPSIDYVNLFSIFWTAGMRKVGDKKKAFAKFKKITSAHHAPEYFCSMLCDDIRARLQNGQMGFDEMHPSTYLNGERWNDELPPPKSFNQKNNYQPNASGLSDAGEATLAIFKDLPNQGENREQ